MPVTILSGEEIRTLRSIANPANTDGVPRLHLEKLSRLDLIEPCGAGLCLSVRGREILVERK